MKWRMKLADSFECIRVFKNTKSGAFQWEKKAEKCIFTLRKYIFFLRLPYPGIKKKQNIALKSHVYGVFDFWLIPKEAHIEARKQLRKVAPFGKILYKVNNI